MSDNSQSEGGFFAQVLEGLAPKANRVIATIAGVRTFGQGLTGSAFVAAGGGISLTAVGVTEINWPVVGFAAIAVVASASISGFVAFRDVLAHGLSSRYAKAVVQQITNSGTAPNTELAAAVTDAAAELKK